MRRLAALLAFAFLSACGGDTSTNPNNDTIEGSYSLRTINGSPMPFKISSGTSDVTLTGDIITIAGNGSWTETISYTETINGKTTTGTEADAGVWVRTGNQIELQSDATGGYSGTFGNGTMTFVSGGFTQVFKR